MSISPITLRRLLRELNSLQNSPPEGIRLAAETFGGDSDEGEGVGDLGNVGAWVEGPPGTPFEGGFFKIRFSFGSDYPAAPPKCTFATKIFHPNVGEDGAICVNTLKKDWKPDMGVSHILIVIKCLLIHPGPDSALNAEAGRLLLEDFAEYSKRAKLMTGIHATPRRRPTEFGLEEKKVEAPTTTVAKAPLAVSARENTDAVLVPVGESGKKRGVVESTVNIGGSEKVVAKKTGATGAKKRGLKRL